MFKLGGTAPKPQIDFARIPTPRPPVLRVTADEYQRGAHLYENYCLTCHGIAAITGGVLPDLRKSGRLQDAACGSEPSSMPSSRRRGCPGSSGT